MSGRSILSSTWKALKKKNKLTINSLPVIFATVLLLALIYALVMLLCLSGTNKGFVIGVLCFNFGWFCIIYPQTQELTLKDSKVRSNIYYVFFSVILSIACVLYVPTLAGPLPQKDSGSKIAALVFGIEIVSKQLMNLTVFLVLVIVEGRFGRIKEEILWCIIHLVTSFVESILLFVMVLPVSISQLDLSEWQKIILYGVLFPLFRYLCGKVMMITLTNMDEIKGFADKKVKLKLTFTLKIGVALCFGATPLFCMLSNSSDILLFSIQYIPHAFASKLSWMNNIPFVETKIKILKSKLYYFFCCCRGDKLAVSPLASKRDIQEKRESNVTKVMKRATLEVIKKIAGNDKLCANSVEENYYDNGDEIENYVTIVEAASVIADKLAIIAYIMALLDLLLFSVGNSGLDFQRFHQAFICIFGVFFTFDQISAIWGFAMIEYQGIELDTDLGLGDGNPLNTIRTFSSGHRWKAIGDLFYMSSFCMCVFLSTAFAQTVRLF